MRDEERDQTWIRDFCRAFAPQENVYVRHEHYDGGYETRMGSATFFVPYEVIDDNDRAWMEDILKKHYEKR